MTLMPTEGGGRGSDWVNTCTLCHEQSVIHLWPCQWRSQDEQVTWVHPAGTHASARKSGARSYHDKLYTLKSLLRQFSVTNTILSVLPLCPLHVHMKLMIADTNTWSLTLVFYNIFTWAPANFMWAQTRVCPGEAMPLDLVNIWISDLGQTMHDEQVCKINCLGWGPFVYTGRRWCCPFAWSIYQAFSCSCQLWAIKDCTVGRSGTLATLTENTGWLGQAWVSPTLAGLHCKTHVYVCLFAAIYCKF